MDWNLLVRHLQLAILLGGLSSGVVETLKQWFFPNIKGKELTVASVLLTAAVSGIIGYFYAEASYGELIAAVIWGVVGAQAVYATVQKLQKPPEETPEDD